MESAMTLRAPAGAQIGTVASAQARTPQASLNAIVLWRRQNLPDEAFHLMIQSGAFTLRHSTLKILEPPARKGCYRCRAAIRHLKVFVACSACPLL